MVEHLDVHLIDYLAITMKVEKGAARNSRDRSALIGILACEEPY